MTVHVASRHRHAVHTTACSLVQKLILPSLRPFVPGSVLLFQGPAPLVCHSVSLSLFSSSPFFAKNEQKERESSSSPLSSSKQSPRPSSKSIFLLFAFCSPLARTRKGREDCSFSSSSSSVAVVPLVPLSIYSFSLPLPPTADSAHRSSFHLLLQHEIASDGRSFNPILRLPLCLLYGCRHVRARHMCRCTYTPSTGAHVCVDGCKCLSLSPPHCRTLLGSVSALCWQTKDRCLLSSSSSLRSCSSSSSFLLPVLATHIFYLLMMKSVDLLSFSFFSFKGFSIVGILLQFLFFLFLLLALLIETG